MKQIKVGVFVAIGLIVLITSIFILGASQSMFSKVIDVKTYFDSVQGLNVGGVVSFSGLKIGNVEKISFNDSKNLIEVILRIDHSFQNKIKTDSLVDIRTQGALGDKYVYITPGKEGTIIKDGDSLKSEYGNDLISVFSKRGSESEKIFDILDDLKKITGTLAAQNKLPSVINKLDTAADHLSSVGASLDKTMKSGNLDRSLQKLDHVMTKIDSGQGSLGALINDRSIHDRLKNILGAGQKDQQIKQILKSSVEE